MVMSNNDPNHSNIHLSSVPHIAIDSYSQAMIMQFFRIQQKVRKLTSHWEEANIIGNLIGIDSKFFETVMNDVLCIYLVS